MLRTVLLTCGILSSLLYVATDILAAMQWKAYSPISQTVSELSALHTHVLKKSEERI